jgi:hypothetical protein
MKSIKKNTITFGAFLVALLFVSTVTAVPQVQSEAVMNQIEKEKERLINEFERLWNRIVDDEPFQVESIRYFDVEPYIDFEDIFDTDGFIDYIVSDDFINFLGSNLDEFLTTTLIHLIYNSNEIQEYIEKEYFSYFANSDEVQYILDKLNDFSEEAFQSKNSVVTQDNQFYTTGIKDLNSEPIINTMLNCYGMASMNCVIEELEEFTFQSEVYQYDDYDPFVVFLVLLVGLITWIPVIILIIIFSPLIILGGGAVGFKTGWNRLFSGGYDTIPPSPPDEWHPGYLINSVIEWLIFAIALMAYTCIYWPTSFTKVVLRILHLKGLI